MTENKWWLNLKEGDIAFFETYSTLSKIKVQKITAAKIVFDCRIEMNKKTGRYITTDKYCISSIVEATKENIERHDRQKIIDYILQNSNKFKNLKMSELYYIYNLLKNCEEVK